MSTPIEGLMGELMGNLKTMIDVNTVVGDTITTPDGTTIIPVSRVSLGFGAGGSEYTAKQGTLSGEKPMFGGGCGGGVTVSPVAFLTIKNDIIRLIPASESMTTVDRIVDMIPEVLNKFNKFIKEVKAEKKED